MIATSDKKGIWKPAVDHDIRFLTVGAGAIVEKLGATWQTYYDRGVKLCAVDILDNPSGRKALPKDTPFYNWKNPAELEKLVLEGLEHPFDFAYLATVPSVHIATALRLDFIARQFIYPKPVDTNYGFMQVMHNEHAQGGTFRDMVSRSCVHDHYRNKPLTRFLREHIVDLHRRNGFLRLIRIYITEHKTIQNEFKRRKSLECGMILDLAPHALSVISEIVPENLTWVDREGNTFRRTRRRFQLVCAIRARDNQSILHNLDSETFAALHFRVFEDIDFVPKSDPEWVDKLDHHFDILIVVGKGVAVQDEATERDLKAIELEFDGQSVRGNFDTNAIAGVIDRALQAKIEPTIDLRHRGLNLPLQLLADHSFGLASLKNGHVIQPFQSFDDAFAIAALMEECRAHHTAHELVRYAPLDNVANVLNRCVAKGLDSMWALEEDPTDLLFGELPADPIP